MKILLVEDNNLTVELLSTVLAKQHYAIDVAMDGEEAWSLIESFVYDIILLDVLLPKLDGISLCRRLRASGNQTPVILLTAKDSSTDRVMGLDAGADDYVAKPFDSQELLARIRALLRRGSSALPPYLEWRSLRLDPSTCEVTWEGQPVRLTPKEYALLETFLRNQNRIYSCSALIDHIWSLEEPPTEDTVRSHLKGLRQKLKAVGVDDPIETVYGIGYRLKPASKEEERETSKGEQYPTHIQAKESNVTSVQQYSQTSQLGEENSGKQLAPESAMEKQTVNKFSEIWKRAKKETLERVAVIEQAITARQKGKLGKKLRSQAEQLAHKLAGSLGMFGSDEGSRLAREIELLFQSGIQEPQQVRQLKQLVVALQEEIQSLNTQSVPELMSNEQPTNTVQQLDTNTEAKIMVVDDDTNVLTVLENLLPPWGLKVSTLKNPLRLWDVLAAEKPDLLVLDIEMPEINGIELCQKIRNNPVGSGLPILFLTARRDAETMHRVFAVGADDYVSKPIVGPELVTRILNRLERTRLLRNMAEIDTMTGLVNRPKSTHQLLELLGKSDRSHQPVSFAIVTLDHLKRINRQYGHAAGDRVLSRLAELLRQKFRDRGVVSRWGGKEFVLGMAGMSKTEGVKRLSEVLESFRQLEFTAVNGTQFQATFSGGVVQYPQDGTDIQTLYQTADTVLYRAKTTGRNKIMLAD